MSNRALISRRVLGGAKPSAEALARAGKLIARELYGRIYSGMYRKLKTRNEIGRLRAADDTLLKSIASALDAVLKRSASAEEKVWVDRIESLRNELNASSTEISAVDYGAGSLDLDSTAEQEYQGRVENTTIGEVCRHGSNRQMWTFLLFKLIRELRPLVCLELGTALGISAAYQAAALELNHHGRIVSLEGAQSLASLARENFERLGLERAVVRVGRFQDTLGEVLREQGQIDFAFMDGHLKEHAILAYFEKIYPFLSKSAVLVLDGISWSKGMARAWSTITADQRVRTSINLFKAGMCIMASSRADKQSFKIALG